MTDTKGNFEEIDNYEERKPVMLFGRDISAIPCFRESFINGILGGLATGIGTFMYTSRPRQACNYAVGSYTLITLIYWSYCRYSWSKEKFIAAQIQEGMRRHAIYQGTDMERQVRSEFEKEMKAEDA